MPGGKRIYESNVRVVRCFLDNNRSDAQDLDSRNREKRFKLRIQEMLFSKYRVDFPIFGSRSNILLSRTLIVRTLAKDL